MKLTLILFLVFASVAVLRAEEPEEQDEPSLTDVYDGSLEDEVLGNEDDPAHFKKKQAMVRNFKHMRICGKVFVKCLVKTKARCKLVPVCKVKYFACRCILKGVSKCKRFLGWVRKMAKKHKGKKHDENEEDESEDALMKKRKWRKIVRRCKRGYGRCSRGKEFCGPCIKKFGVCIKKSFLKHVCKAHGHKGDEPVDEDEEEEHETAMANLVEHEDTEEDVKQVDEDEPEEDALKRGGKKPSLAQIRCAKRGLRCMLRAKMNCRRQGRCMRRAMRCFRRATRRRPGKN